MKPWTMGFTGALTAEMCRWVDEQIPQEVESVCVPFLGSAKAVSLFARPHRFIDCWDTQYLLECMMTGVWNAKEPEYQVGDAPKLVKGYVYEERPFGTMPDDAAGLIDGIAAKASMYERIALATAIARSSYRGRISQWSPPSTATTLWQAFQKRLEYQKDYLDMPGDIRFHRQNFYESRPEPSYDMAYIDPPKIVSTTDAYSGTYGKLNRAIGEPESDSVPFDRWVRYDYTGRIRALFSKIQTQDFIFIYTSHVRPNLDEMIELLNGYGTLVERKSVNHRSRIDYGLRYTQR